MNASPTHIVNHVGGVSRVGIYAGKDDEIIPVWKEGITAAAACHNHKSQGQPTRRTGPCRPLRDHSTANSKLRRKA